MICYFDTSAFVPVILSEKGSETAREVWRQASGVTSTHLLYVEAAAALAQASRMGRLKEGVYPHIWVTMERLWRQFEAVHVSEGTVRRAATLADRYGLRGYDAVHCAAAELFRSPNLVVASGDQKLLGAWRDLGLQVLDTSH